MVIFLRMNLDFPFSAYIIWTATVLFTHYAALRLTQTLTGGPSPRTPLNATTKSILQNYQQTTFLAPNFNSFLAIFSGLKNRNQHDVG